MKRSNRPNQNTTRADNGQHKNPDRNTYSNISPDTQEKTQISQTSYTLKIPLMQQKEGQGLNLLPPQVQFPKDPELREGRIFPQPAPNPPSIPPTIPEDQNILILQPSQHHKILPIQPKKRAANTRPDPEIQIPRDLIPN